MAQLLADNRDVATAKLSDVQKAQCSWDELCAQIDAFPAAPALRAISGVSRDLLNRTAELPDKEQGLLVVLSEYRRAVHAFVAAAEKL